MLHQTNRSRTQIRAEIRRKRKNRDFALSDFGDQKFSDREQAQR